MLVRGGILTTLTIVSGVLTVRWLESDDCQKQNACGSCSLSDGCKLPEVDKYRLEKARMNKPVTKDGKAGA